MTTTIFLDFDGVLHPDAAYLEKGRPVLRAEGELFMWSHHLIEALAPYPAIKIVLSTSWARTFGFSRARDFLPNELASRCLGATWHSAMRKSEFGGGNLVTTWWDDVTRYQQISRYVGRARLEDWIALDDNDDEWAESARQTLVLTDPDKGIGDPIALARLRGLLSGTTR